MTDSKQMDSKDDWHTNEDKRVQCLQINWVAIISNLSTHLARIFDIIHQVYEIRITHSSILPEYSHHRSRTLNVTTSMIDTTNTRAATPST
jgi:hypothetical protein